MGIYILHDWSLISFIFNVNISNLNKKVGSRCKKPQEFFWSDNSVINPKFYSGGGPDNYQGSASVISQGCLVFLSTYGLDDEACLRALPFVCSQIWRLLYKLANVFYVCYTL